MTPAEQRLEQEVRCPICLHEFLWQDAPYALINKQTGRLELLDQRFGQSRAAWDAELLEERVGRRCPSLKGEADIPDHLLPLNYGDEGPPIVIGTVGRAKSGKSHLLAAMVGEIERGGLRALGLQALPLDPSLHQQYMDSRVRRLLDDHKKIPQTETVLHSAGFIDGFVIEHPSTQCRRVVALFDINGEFQITNNTFNRFFSAANALIFVVDPETIPGLASNGNALPGGLGDPTFTTVLDRVRRAAAEAESSNGYLPIPAAVVVAKSDLIEQNHEEVRRFYRGEGMTEGLRAEAVDQETREAFAFLCKHNASAWLAPVEHCLHTSLHFVSATGCSLRTDGCFPHVTPTRVLEPLATLLARLGLFEARGQWKVR